jgi:hypothetical protein
MHVPFSWFFLVFLGLFLGRLEIRPHLPVSATTPGAGNRRPPGFFFWSNPVWPLGARYSLCG